MVLAERQHTMALDQSALLEVLDALKAAEVDDRIQQGSSVETYLRLGSASAVGSCERELIPSLR